MSHPSRTLQVANGSQPLCIPQLLTDQAQRRPDALAILAPGRLPLTYGALRRHIDDTVQTLWAMGVGSQDRVALVMPNGPDMAVAFLAVASCATCAPLNPAYSADEFASYLADLNVKALLIQAGLDSAARGVAQACGIMIIELSSPIEAEAGRFTLAGERYLSSAPHRLAEAGDVALILQTSGTTTRPKIVPLTHANICSAAHHMRVALELDGRDRCLNVLPLFHIFGLMVMMRSLAAGASTICPPDFYALHFFDWLKAFRPTWYSAVPTVHQAILAQAENHRETIAHCPLQFILSGSAPLPSSVRSELEAVFNTRVFEGYGLTETSSGVTIHPPPNDERRTGSPGVAIGAKVAIMDAMGFLLETGQIGEIVVQGAAVFSGYENDFMGANSAFTNGWFRTGDQGYVDADGYLFVMGRLKELINRGGEKITPQEVDDVLMNHPAVIQAATFAVPHAQLGEDIAAAVVLSQGAFVTGEELRKFALTHLAPFKIPSQILIVDHIPKGHTGKLQRTSLAEKFGLLAYNQLLPERQTAFTAPRTSLEKKLAAFWLQVLNIERIGIYDDFFKLGGSSLMAEQLLFYIRETMHVEVSIGSFFEMPTIIDIAKYIETHLKMTQALSSSPDILADDYEEGSL